MKKRKWILIIAGIALLAGILFLYLNRQGGASHPENLPYEPDTPPPSPHTGVFVSDDSTFTFSGDGESITVECGPAFSALSGLPEGETKGTYLFTSYLPPYGMTDVRYDTAHNMEIFPEDGEHCTFDIGYAAEDGKTFTVYIGAVTEDTIPLCFQTEEGFRTVEFRKKQ